MPCSGVRSHSQLAQDLIALRLHFARLAHGCVGLAGGELRGGVGPLRLHGFEVGLDGFPRCLVDVVGELARLAPACRRGSEWLRPSAAPWRKDRSTRPCAAAIMASASAFFAATDAFSEAMVEFSDGAAFTTMPVVLVGEAVLELADRFVDALCSSSAAYFSASARNSATEDSTWATAFSAGSFWLAQAASISGGGGKRHETSWQYASGSPRTTGGIRESAAFGRVLSC